MKRNDPVQNVMTRQLVTVHTASRVSEARRALAEGSFHHLPVVSGDVLVGMISTLDLTKVDLAGWGTDTRSLDAVLDHQFTIEDLMTKNMSVLKKGDTVRDAAKVLAEGKFHGVPVVDDQGRLLGLVTTTDLVRYLLEQY